MTEHYQDTDMSWTENEAEESHDEAAKSRELVSNMRGASKNAAEFLSCLGNPYRLQILAMLMDGDKNVSEISKVIKIRQSLTSQHLSRLRRAGLVEAHRIGRYVSYSIENTAAKEILQILHQHLCIDGNKITTCRQHKPRKAIA